MIEILLNGCNGAMGTAISQYVNKRDDADIIAGIDKTCEMHFHYPVYESITDFHGDADVIIDFSNPSAFDSVIYFAVSKGIPAVIATTGLSDVQHEKIKAAAKRIPVFSSANMSLGINLLCALAKKAEQILGADFDIEIVEAHHHNKIDAPSGTALMLYNSLCEESDEKMHAVYDRHSYRQKREKNEIGIHSIRGGTIVGEHEVIFAGEDEVITLSHSARSKTVFALGAVNAAEFLIGKEPGIYDMNDLINENTAG